MCFSATVSYSASAVLVTTGLYALQQARRLQGPYWVLALIPIFFGIQQAFEGRVWQEIDAGRAGAAVPFALGFHFFSHFLWLWWLPLSSYLLEQHKMRKRVFLGFTIFGALAGGLVYFTTLFHPDWMSVAVRQHSILYRISSTYHTPLSIPIPASALYGLTVLVPLLFSSYRHLRIFGALVALSMVLASLAYGYAFVSVWCFFAAAISIYFVYMLHQIKAASRTHG